MSELPVLYTFRRCPYAMRARLALASSQTVCEQREVVLRNKPAQLLAASAKATVPVLVLPDGQVIDESLHIIRWALAQHDPEGWLPPCATTARETARLVAANDGPFKQHLDRYKYPHRYAAESGLLAPGASPLSVPDALALIGLAQTHRDQAARWLNELDGLLGGGWLLGGRGGLADMALLPFVRQFAHTDAAWFAAQPWPRVQGWLQRFEASERYSLVMQKQAPWQQRL